MTQGGEILRGVEPPSGWARNHISAIFYCQNPKPPSSRGGCEEEGRLQAPAISITNEVPTGFRKDFCQKSSQKVR